jgi:hypothetical protein
MLKITERPCIKASRIDAYIPAVGRPFRLPVPLILCGSPVPAMFATTSTVQCMAGAEAGHTVFRCRGIEIEKALYDSDFPPIDPRQALWFWGRIRHPLIAFNATFQLTICNYIEYFQSIKSAEYIKLALKT